MTSSSISSLSRVSLALLHPFPNQLWNTSFLQDYNPNRFVRCVDGIVHVLELSAHVSAIFRGGGDGQVSGCSRKCLALSPQFPHCPLKDWQEKDNLLGVVHHPEGFIWSTDRR